MDMPKRVPMRLKEYDYSQNGVYFVTICTDKRKNILSQIAFINEDVGEGLCALPQTQLTDLGKIVDSSINHIGKQNNIQIDKYVIMPNHVHILMSLVVETGGHRGPPLHSIIGQLKSYTTYKCGCKIWQRSFFDHIIRDENDYLRCWQYINNNPIKWELDKYYAGDKE